MRVEGKCAGDCSKCELLQNGQVDMIPCVMDQVFQRIQRIEKRLIENENVSAKLAEIPQIDE